MSAISRRKALNIIAHSFGILLLPLGLTYASDGKRPQIGITPLDEHKQLQVSPGDRCPVCGMNVIRYPKFNSAIQLKNTATYYFCSTGCMIRSWMHPEIYLGVATDMLQLPVVREYFSGRQVDARDIIFVYGSDVIGPMGPALVPVKDGNYLTVFKKRHGGKTQFLLKDLTDVKWHKMTGKEMVK